jgi:regulator of CtrA degradation
MARTTNLSRPIIEALYTEALVLADEVRAVFTIGTREPLTGCLHPARALDRGT